MTENVSIPKIVKDHIVKESGRNYIPSTSNHFVYL